MELDYGVPLCKKICELHGFQYEITSQYLHGTTVMIHMIENYEKKGEIVK